MFGEIPRITRSSSAQLEMQTVFECNTLNKSGNPIKDKNCKNYNRFNIFA